MLSLYCTRILLLAAVFRQRNKSDGRGCARLFRPMYAGANMGHPSREEGVVVGSNRTVIPPLGLDGRKSYESS
jgi:hypothetical protein